MKSISSWLSQFLGGKGGKLFRTAHISYTGNLALFIEVRVALDVIRYRVVVHRATSSVHYWNLRSDTTASEK